MQRIGIEEGRRAFGADAANYDSARPDYPERVFEVIRDRCGSMVGLDAFEIGAGTGLATRRLLQLGVRLQVHDPEAMANVRAIYGAKLTYAELPMDALDGADALAIVTEWGEFRNPEFDEMKSRMRQPVVFDGRNLYNPRQMKSLGFTYHCIGKTPVQ